MEDKIKQLTNYYNHLIQLEIGRIQNLISKNATIIIVDILLIIAMLIISKNNTFIIVILLNSITKAFTYYKYFFKNITVTQMYISEEIENDMFKSIDIKNVEYKNNLQSLRDNYQLLLIVKGNYEQHLIFGEKLYENKKLLLFLMSFTVITFFVYLFVEFL